MSSRSRSGRWALGSPLFLLPGSSSSRSCGRPRYRDSEEAGGRKQDAEAGSRAPRAAVIVVCLTLTLLAACQREERRFREIPPGASPSSFVTQNDAVQPGPVIVDPEMRNAYEQNAWAVAEGEQLYNAFNCAGCHAPGGGGGFGPPLIDSLWIYGSEPENLYQSIVEGRPNGMPAFRGRLGSPDVWKLVAYVRSLNSLTPKGTRSGRSETVHGASNDPQREPNLPMEQRIPPEQLPPPPPPRQP
jgi:cytochrome c oxidase cbb3-type subunit III